ncbi:unnamed protein product [Auanema sp. JU1783]|nr:unnamed protein product [Auanema sp. JU1783]
MLRQVVTRSRSVRRLFYHKAERNPNFKYVADKDLKFFENVLGSGNVAISEIETYNADWSKWYKGKASCVLLPATTEETSALLSYCFENNIAVVPQAGNTGLVGGSIPVHDEVIISVKRIRDYFNFDEVTGVLTCDAGFVLEELDQKISKKGYMMPFDLGAKGSCMIGGNIATCAGGIRLLRYGSLHAHLLGLTAVLPDHKGTVLRLGSALRKDNTSLHTPHLFLGSEGQLGIITRVTMTTVPKPISVQSAMIGTDSFEACCNILKLARSELSEILSSFEFMDRATIECVRDTLGLNHVLSSNPNFNILIETSGSNETHDKEKMANFLEQCMDSGLAVDGIQARSHMEANEMWKLRESAPLAVAKDGWVFKNDVSLPLDSFYKLSEHISAKFKNRVKRVVTYGHLGDGNSHLNITSEKYEDSLYKELYPYLYEWVAQHEGSISAEHGIGQMKLPYAHLSKSPEERKLIRDLKTIFDPKGILNPYKLISY